MSSNNDNCSTTGNIPDIVEMSFRQMEGQCYKCGAKDHISNTSTKNVAKGQWYMDKMKTQDTNRMLSKVQKSFWSCTHVNSCQNYTLYYQSTYFIEYFMQGNFKYP